jgi:phosphoserine phosphatase
MSSLGVSLFDLDETLYIGYVIIDLANFLATDLTDLDRDFIEDELTAAQRKYKKRIITRKTFAERVLNIFYGRCLAQHKVEVIEESVDRFWSLKGGTGWFSYADRLVALMQQYTQTVLITGSPLEAMGYVKDRFNFFGDNQVYASSGHKQGQDYDGHFTEFASKNAKKLLVNQLKAYQSFRPETSFAFGDSDSDIPLFEAVIAPNCFVFAKGRNKEEWPGWLTDGESSGWHVLYYDEGVEYIVGQVVQRVQQVVVS